MHARMTIAQAQPDRFDEALSEVQGAFLPAAREHNGYQGFLLLADRSRQQLVGISFWETEADLRSSDEANGYYRQRIEGFAELLVSPPATSTLEVAVREP